MRIQSVDSYRSPKIPTRDYVDDNPEILNHIPRRWMSDAVVLTALAGTVMLLSLSRMNATSSIKPISKVSPLFNHGDTKWAQIRGKIAVPVFLSEDAARDVVRKEAAKYGVSFDTSAESQEVIEIPTLLNKHNKNVSTTVILDGVDKKHNICFEVITTNDAVGLRVKKAVSYASSMYDTKNAADGLRNGLRRAHPRGIYGVFYAPSIRHSDIMKSSAISTNKNQAELDKQAKAHSKQLLRAQVKDFIKWLKAEGVI